MNNSEIKNKLHIGILAAMPEEIGAALSKIKHISKISFGDLTIYSGIWKENYLKNFSIYLSIAWSGWGKVSSARAATRLISHSYNDKSIDLILFTGVAGAVDPSLEQWDIVVPNSLMQHDMDASPIFEKYTIPALDQSEIKPNKELFKWILDQFKEKINPNHNLPFKNIHSGLIATGDQFISDKNKINILRESIDKVIAIEMEGAAVAQVAQQENKPWIIIRVISDSADDDAPENFTEFISKYQEHSWSLIELLLNSIDTKLLKILKK